MNFLYWNRFIKIYQRQFCKLAFFKSWLLCGLKMSRIILIHKTHPLLKLSHSFWGVSSLLLTKFCYYYRNHWNALELGDNISWLTDCFKRFFFEKEIQLIFSTSRALNLQNMKTKNALFVSTATNFADSSQIFLWFNTFTNVWPSRRKISSLLPC